MNDRKQKLAAVMLLVGFAAVANDTEVKMIRDGLTDINGFEDAMNELEEFFQESYNGNKRAASTEAVELALETLDKLRPGLMRRSSDTSQTA